MMIDVSFNFMQIIENKKSRFRMRVSQARIARRETIEIEKKLRLNLSISPIKGWDLAANLVIRLHSCNRTTKWEGSTEQLL